MSLCSEHLDLVALIWPLVQSSVYNTQQIRDSCFGVFSVTFMLGSTPDIHLLFVFALRFSALLPGCEHVMQLSILPGLGLYPSGVIVLIKCELSIALPTSHEHGHSIETTLLPLWVLAAARPYDGFILSNMPL